MQIIKTVLRGKITANQAYFRKQEKSQINNLKQLERGQTKHSRRKEIIKFRAEIETKNNRKVYEIKSWFFGKINKIDKLLTRFLKEEKENPGISSGNIDMIPFPSSAEVNQLNRKQEAEKLTAFS